MEQYITGNHRDQNNHPRPRFVSFGQVAVVELERVLGATNYPSGFGAFIDGEVRAHIIYSTVQEYEERDEMLRSSSHHSTSSSCSNDGLNVARRGRRRHELLLGQSEREPLYVY